MIGRRVSHFDVFQKLKAIEELKEMQASGKVLQKNQVTEPRTCRLHQSVEPFS